MLSLPNVSAKAGLFRILEQVRVALRCFLVDDGGRDERQGVLIPDAQRHELPIVLRLEERRVQAGRLQAL